MKKVPPWGFVLSMDHYRNTSGPDSIKNRYFGGDELNHVYVGPEEFCREQLLDNEDIEYFRNKYGRST